MIAQPEYRRVAVDGQMPGGISHGRMRPPSRTRAVKSVARNTAADRGLWSGCVQAHTGGITASANQERGHRQPSRPSDGRFAVVTAPCGAGVRPSLRHSRGTKGGRSRHRPPPPTLGATRSPPARPAGGHSAFDCRQDVGPCGFPPEDSNTVTPQFVVKILLGAGIVGIHERFVDDTGAFSGSLPKRRRSSGKRVR